MVNSQNPRRKKLFSTSLEPSTRAWIDDKIKSGLFRDRTHGIESCVAAVSRLPKEDQIKFLFFPENAPVFLPDESQDKLAKMMRAKKFSSVGEMVWHCLEQV